MYDLDDYFSTGSAVMSTLGEGEFELALHTVGCLGIGDPRGCKLAQVRDGKCRIGTTLWW